MLIWMMLFCQTGVEAGPARVSCEGSPATLAATLTNPPLNYLLQWEDGMDPGPFLVASPTQTTTYRVVLTDLDTLQVYEDTTRILVHPFGADLVPDGNFNEEDWLALFQAWGQPPVQPAFDPDQDGTVSILDWFYLCNFIADPINTPPTLQVDDQVTFKNENLNIDVVISDEEQQPILQIAAQPLHGSAFLLSGSLWYNPNPDFVGTDTVEVQVTDGTYTTLPRTINIQVLEPDVWADLFNNIFFIKCKACHIDAVSGGLSLSTYGLTQQGGNNGAGFIPGNPSNSPIYLRVADGSMPLGQPNLSAQEIERIRQWILRGAPEL